MFEYRTTGDTSGCIATKPYTEIGASVPTLKFSFLHFSDDVLGFAIAGPRADRITNSGIELAVDDKPVFRGQASQLQNTETKLIGPISVPVLDAVLAGKVLTLRAPNDQIVLRLNGSEDAIRRTSTCTADVIAGMYRQRGIPLPPQEFRVVHVISDNVLNLRSDPTSRSQLVAAIPGGSGRVMATGECRPGIRTDFVWCPVTWQGRGGWVALGGLMPVLPPLPSLQAAPPTTASIQPRSEARPSPPAATTSRDAAAAPPATPPPETPQHSFGSGFFVSRSGHILTNAHVVDQCQAIGVRQPGAFGLKRAALVAADRRNDLALLRLADIPPIEPLPLRRQVRVGENAAVFGFPMAGTVASAGIFTTGSISALAGLGDDTSQVQMMVPIQPGSSGGPVLDSHGNVDAVVVSKLNGLVEAARTGTIPEQVNFAIKAAIAAAFLEANGVVADEPRTDRRLDNPDLADRARASTVAVLCVGRG